MIGLLQADCSNLMSSGSRTAGQLSKPLPTVDLLAPESCLLYSLYMILQQGDPIVAISQPSHSWLSGQLARVWGNDQFNPFEPFEPICLAAEQHDVGFLGWEREPVLDPQTGLPYNFDCLPEAMHFDLWARGISELKPVCWYSALIVSLHFCDLCQRFHHASAKDPKSAATRFLREQTRFQETTVAQLSRDPEVKSAVTTELLEFHRALLGVWDFLSLQLCRGRADHFRVPAVPLEANKSCDMTVRVRPNRIVEVDPWPFQAESFDGQCEARILKGPFVDEAQMRSGLEESDQIKLVFHFAPAKAD